MCRRGVGGDEFVFEDGDHAIAFYKAAKTLRVCDECAGLHEKKQAAAHSGMPESGAMRGLKWGST